MDYFLIKDNVLDMDDNIKDIVEQASYNISDAYQRGLNIGRESGTKIPESREMLRGFISFIKKYRFVYTDFGISFADGDNIYSEDIIIKNFLLTYDYDKE